MADTSTATDKKSALSPPEPDSFQPSHSTDHASSDDDDWFNKSLDEFEVPTVTASHQDDRWSDEDKDEEEKTSESNQLAQDEPQTARPHDTKEEDDSKQDTDKKEKRVVVLSPVGVTFALLPATSKHFKVMLDRPWSVPKSVRPDENDKEGNDGNEKDSSVEEGDTRTEPTKRDESKDTAVEEDTRAGPTKRDKGKDTEGGEENTKTEPTKRDEGKDTAVEEDTGAGPTKRDKGKDTEGGEENTKTEPTKRDEGKDTAVEEDTGAGPTKRDKGKDTEVEEDTKAEPVNAGKDTEGSNKEEDEGDEIQKEEVCGNAAEAFEKLGDNEEEKTDLDEDKDEEWFQTQLKELPTMFNHPGVHSLSEAKLRKNQTMLRHALQDDESDSSDGEEELLKDDIYSDSNLNLLVVLLRTDSGDFSFVEEILVKRTRTEHEQKEGKTKTLSRLFLRNHHNACFLVVITWLLGRSPDAETQARRLALQYPYSFVAVANLFYILWKKGDKADAVAILRPLLRLKEKKPDVYQAVLMEDLGEIVVCFTEMGPEFIPYILELLETILPHRPHWNRGKWHCALNLRRLTNAKHTWMNPMTDVVTPLLKATDILIDMLQGSLTRSSGNALVAAELGDILSSCAFDEKLQDTVGKRAHDAGLDAAKCFDIVMQMEDSGGSNLVRAGKYFRYKGQLKKSEEALKKAVAVQDSAKVHHQLALTLKKMAVEESRRAWQEVRSQWARRGGLLSRYSGRTRRGVGREGIGSISRSRILAGDSLMADMERSMKSQITYFSLSREDPHVKETMHHLNKALMLSHGENSEVSYDLALMYKVLGEHSDALQQFLTIIEIDEHPSHVVCAYEQSGLMLLEKSSQEETDDRARKLQEDARSLLTMALLVQSHIVCQFRHEHDDHNQSIWQSFHSLGQYLHLEQLQRPVTVCAEQSPVEVWLMRLLRVYADTVPVLLSIQQITHHDATDPHAVQSKVSKYLRDQRYQDTALFISLLRLTDQWPVLRSALQDMIVRAQVLAARAKLTADTKAGQISPTFNSSMAKRFFCWTFEDMHPHTPGSYLQGPPPGDMLENSASGSCESSVEQVAVESDSAKSYRSPYTESSSIAGHQGDSTHQADGQRKQKTDTLQADRQKKGNKGKLSVSQVVAMRETLRKSETGSGDHELEDVESEVVSLKYHVLLVHDSEDSDAAAAALAVQGVLQNTCGLRTQLSKDSSPAARRKATLQAMGQAHLILFVVGSKETSPELKTYLAQAASRLQDQPSSATNQSAGIQASKVRRNILTLTLDNTPIWSLPTLLQAHPSFPWPSKKDSRSMLCKADFVCKLFCFLTGADLKF